MPPRLRLTPFQAGSIAPRALPPAFLLPFLQVQTRSASILSSLSDVPSSYNKRIRKGRGPSSGKGKTSGRGHKGQGQHGKVPVGFQGGQTTEEVVKGTRGEYADGEKNPFTKELSIVNLDTIQSWIEQKRLDPSQPITLKELAATRAVHGVKPDGVKLLSRGSETFNVSGVHIITTRASSAAIAAVEAAGGKVTTRYYTPASVKRIKLGHTHPYVSLAWKGDDHLNDSPLAKGFEFRLPDPIGRTDLEYYRDPKHRGYLSYMVGEGESPSLFFQTPLQTQRRKEAVGKTKTKDVGQNRIW